MNFCDQDIVVAGDFNEFLELALQLEVFLSQHRNLALNQ